MFGWWKSKSSEPGCSTCGKQINITSIERRFLQQHDLAMPRLCRSCRINRVEDEFELSERPRLIAGK